MKPVILVICIFLGISSSIAQNWTGAVNSDWNNTANWSVAPANGDNILIDPANYSGAMADPVIVVNSNFNPGEMLIQNGAELVIQANLNADDRVEVIGAGTLLQIESGTFTVNGNGNNARLIISDGAHLQANGGVLICGQRLLFELGATGEINNNAVITVGETIALIDGNAGGSTFVVQNGGIVTTNVDFGFENEAGVFVPTYEMNAGQLHVNGDMIWLGALPGAGTGYFIANGGDVTITGVISNDPTSTMNMQIELYNSSEMHFEGTAVSTLTGDSIIVENGAAWLETNTVSWQHQGVFFADSSSFHTGTTTLNGTGSFQFSNVTIPSGKQLIHTSPSEISVSGDIVFDGLFSAGTNKVVVNGSSAQTISGSSLVVPTFYDLTINNTDLGTTMAVQTAVSHSLELIEGIVFTDQVNYLQVLNGASATGGSVNSFIDGYLRKAGNQAFDFPLGKSPDRYRPLSIDAPTTATTIVAASYQFSPFTSLVPVEMPLQSVSAVEYWDVTRSGSSDLFTAAVGWNDATSSGLTDCAAISMGVWNGSSWNFVPSTTSGLCAGNNAGMLQGSTVLPVIGPITIGFTQGVTQQVVHLCAGESITVDTNTYMQSGVYIDVLTDVNGDDSTIVTVLTVNEQLNLTLIDNLTSLESMATESSFQWGSCTNGFTPIAGATNALFVPDTNGVYAVVVTQNGCSDTSDCSVIDQLGIDAISAIHLILYPNPVGVNSQLFVKSDMTFTMFEVRGLDGRLVQKGNIPVQPENELVIKTDFLEQGIYHLLLLEENGEIIMKQFTVNNPVD